MAEHDELNDRYDASVWHAINEQLLRKISWLAILLQQAPIHQASASHMITGIHVPQPQDSSLLIDAPFAALCQRGSFADWSPSTKADGSKDVQAILVMIHSKADPGAVLEIVMDVVNRYFTRRSLRLSDPLDAARSLSVYGIDLLAAVEFRNWLRVDLGLS